MNKGVNQIQIRETWERLAALALRGLEFTYARKEALPHTVQWSHGTGAPIGSNTRYALISLLGLAKVRSDLSAQALIHALWDRVRNSREKITQTAGDLGLVLWAQALIDTAEFSPSDALRIFKAQRDGLDSVHLAWLILGATHALELQSDSNAEELVQLASRDLLSLFNPRTGLFYRHGGRGILRSVTRRVPCFANQIYPVMALARHGRRADCWKSIEAGRAVAETVCRLQGPQGQWWWLYDATEGNVVDGYPVFSVHQDGMAPMALMETTASGGRSYETEIQRGLAWIEGENELNQNMILAESGLVLRDIHRRGVGRVRRGIRSGLACWGFSRRYSDAGNSQSFRVNFECRPYHLGWILYAASLYLDCELQNTAAADVRA